MKKSLIFLFLFMVITGLFMFLFLNKTVNEWVIDDIKFKVRDGFELDAYYLHPKNSKKKHPAVACLHQLWGNRDDFLKIFPRFAKSGIVAIAPNFLRQQINLNPNRISDLRDAVEYLEKMPEVDNKRIGIITASFTVETGMMAIRGKKNVIADVMISGPLISENSKKWITQNTDLAIYAITSLYDQKPGYPPHHHLLMEECLKRSLNPFSRSYFIKDKSNPYSIYAHGTFLFDEKPKSINLLGDFFDDVFEIKNYENGYIADKLPKYTVYFNSTDGFPVAATFRQPSWMKKKTPAVILYPPEYNNRNFYNKIIYSFISRGVTVLVPNIKRTCRAKRTLHLCEKEIGGAIEFLRNTRGIDKNKIGILFPSFYFLSAKQLIEDGKISVKTIILMNYGRRDYGIEPQKLLGEKSKYKIFHLKKKNFNKIVYIFGKNL